jgi:hypothetical protein
MAGINVNILLHGLFFMTQEGNNLRVYAPNTPMHHFVGGTRGSRQELQGTQDLTQSGLQGKIDGRTGQPVPPDPDNDIEGSVMRFSLGDVTGFNGLNDEDPPGTPIFRGSLLLPWPIKITGLRAGDISASFRTNQKTIATHIVDNARKKTSTTLGVVALLEYTLPALNPVGGLAQINIHYYLQPCTQHKITEVNGDLTQAQVCFKNKAGFDLQMLTGAQEPDPIPPSAHLEFGTTIEDEQSFDEERAKSPDAISICRNDPQRVIAKPPIGAGQPAVSPANCPIFFVG